jgi:hypothetical protein
MIEAGTFRFRSERYWPLSSARQQNKWSCCEFRRPDLVALVQIQTRCVLAAIMSGMMPRESGRYLSKGRHFDREVIALCVRWYLSFKLSSRDLVEMMSERGLVLAHTPILRWMQRYVPEFEKCWSRYARAVSSFWRCDETYIKMKGRWTYLYRAVDKQGRTVDFLLSEKRDVVWRGY